MYVPLLHFFQTKPAHNLTRSPEHKAARWQSASRRLLEKRGTILRVFLLVDASRGLCDEDRTMVATLEQLRRPYSVVLTKVDTLSSDALARAHAVVVREVHDIAAPSDSGSVGGKGKAAVAKAAHAKAAHAKAWFRPATTFHAAQLPMISAKHAQGIAQLWREISALGEASDETHFSNHLGSSCSEVWAWDASEDGGDGDESWESKRAAAAVDAVDDEVGPDVIEADGSVSSVESWNEMPAEERKLVREFIGHRNAERRAALREEGRGEQRGVDMSESPAL